MIFEIPRRRCKKRLTFYSDMAGRQTKHCPRCGAKTTVTVDQSSGPKALSHMGAATRSRNPFEDSAYDE
jgi:uncharacterized paraquat-inducible protein A